MRAQRAIERVYHDHRIDQARDFETAISNEVLENKVRRFLRQSRALEQQFKTPVTAQMLDRELERIIRDTRDPERLSELFAALDNDPVLIRECLARPILVNRLVRNFYSSDDAIHAEARREVEQLRAALIAGRVDADDAHANRVVDELSFRTQDHEPAMQDRGESDTHAMDAGSFDSRRALAPGTVGEIGEITETSRAFEVRVLLAEGAGWARVAVYTIRKRDPALWWNEFEATPVSTTAARDATLPMRDVTDGCDGGAWDPGMDSPSPRTQHIAVWTGSEMIVWGPTGPSGGRYDPATDTWTSTSTTGAPELGKGLTAVWTGTELIVWGGARYDGGWIYYNTGGRYDPVADAWSPVSSVGAPAQRRDHTAVWTGTEMIVWGGDGSLAFDDGGRYDPAADRWSPVSNVGAPGERYSHTAVWTGSKMIVWGGYSSGYLGDGARYDPDDNSWTLVSTWLAPPSRADHDAVWTGEMMIIWGGTVSGGGGSSATFSGGRYDPADNSWLPITETGEPWALGTTSIWSGDEMIVCCGNPNGGWRYDPQMDIWNATAFTDLVGDRRSHTAVWTGREMIVWGGIEDGDYLGTGARYVPETDSWRPTETDNAPLDRIYHRAVWTGREMIVWGGQHDVFEAPESQIDTGIYRPLDVDGDGLCGEDDCDDLNPHCGLDCTDADTDGYCVTHDCDESNSNCTTDCTDADSDGYCITADCDDTIASCALDCSDYDDDGLLRCAADCDDHNANCTTDCTDSDADGDCVTTDCDDTKGNCTTDCTDADTECTA